MYPISSGDAKIFSTVAYSVLIYLEGPVAVRRALYRVFNVAAVVSLSRTEETLNLLFSDTYHFINDVLHTGPTARVGYV